MSRSLADVLFQRFCRSGDPGALARLFDLTAPELFRVAAWLSGDRHLAEDLVQTTFLTAIQDAKTFEHGRPVIPWLLGILANRARLAKREDARHAKPDRVAQPATEDPAVEAERRELAESLERALRELHEPYREVLFLHLQHGLSAKEVAEALARPAGTVRTQIVRGMELLRGALPASLVAGAVFIAVPGNGLAPVRAAVLESAGTAAPGALTSSLFGGALLMKNALIPACLLVVGAGVYVKFGRTLPDPAERAQLAASQDRSANPPETRMSPEDSRAADEQAKSGLRAALPQPLAAGKAGLVVRARWEDDQRPAEGVLVYASPADATADQELRIARTRSCAGGLARFADLVPGKVFVEGDRGGRMEVELAAGEWKEATFVIPAGVTVVGKVVDAGEEPVPDARVCVSCPSRELTAGVEVATTDAAGRFRIRSVQPGRSISALVHGRTPAPAVTLSKKAQGSEEITLQVGGAAGILRGVVHGPDDRPMPEVTVAVGSADAEPDEMNLREDAVAHGSPPHCIVRTDERGEFVADCVVPEPEVAVWVRAPDCAIWKGQVALRPKQETVIAVRLRRGARVIGLVRDAKGSPLAGAHVSAWQDGIEPQTDVAFTGPSWAEPCIKTDAAGRFVLSGLLPGKVKLRASDGQTQWAARSFELAEGEAATWEVALGSGFSISGIVTDSTGNALSNWRVWVESERGVQGPGETLTAADGTFRLAGCEDTPQTASTSRGMSRAAATARDVRPGGEAVRLVVPEERMPTAFVSGMFADPDGNPITGESFFLSLRRLQEDGGSEHGSAERKFEGGRFTLGPVIAGRYEILAAWSNVGGSMNLGVHQLEAKRVLDLGTIRFARPGFVRMNARDADGKPLAAGSFLVVLGDRLCLSNWLEVTAGSGRSEPTQPGRYRVHTWPVGMPLWSHEVEVRSGEETLLDVTIPRGVVRTVRWPAVKTDGLQLTHTWKTRSGTIFAQSTCIHGAGAGRNVSQERFVPGTYQVEISDLLGHVGKATIVIDDREESDQVIELPCPAEVRRRD